MAIGDPTARTSNVQDKTVAFDMLKDSKFCIAGVAKASAEATSPELRRLLNDALNDVMAEHYVLSDMLIRKGWYHPRNVQQQLQTDLQMAQQITSQ